LANGLANLFGSPLTFPQNRKMAQKDGYRITPQFLLLARARMPVPKLVKNGFNSPLRIWGQF
jgi:hypothetical protein